MKSLKSTKKIIKKKLKLFIVKKYIMAESAHDALKKERRHRPDDVFVDSEWRTQNPEQKESCIGFVVEHDYWTSDEEANKKH